MTEEQVEAEREVDRIKYLGNDVPFFIKFFWLAITIYTIAYLAVYAWPDLKAWIK